MGKKSSTLPPVFLSLACCDEQHLNDGSLLKDALRIIDENDSMKDCQCVFGIGINCCSYEYGGFKHSIVCIYL